MSELSTSSHLVCITPCQFCCCPAQIHVRLYSGLSGLVLSRYMSVSLSYCSCTSDKQKYHLSLIILLSSLKITLSKLHIKKMTVQLSTGINCLRISVKIFIIGDFDQDIRQISASCRQSLSSVWVGGRMADLRKLFLAIIFYDSNTSDCKDCFTPCVYKSLLILITALQPNLLCHLQLHTLKLYIVKTASKTFLAQESQPYVQAAGKLPWKK